MYHTTSGIPAEVTLHLALIIAGAGGYVFVQWMNRNLCPSREGSSSKTKAASTDDVVDVQAQPKVAPNKLGKGARGHRRSKQKAATAETMSELTAGEVCTEVCSVRAGAEQQAAIEEDTSTLRKTDERLSSDVATGEKPEEILVESATDLQVAPMSDRVIRLLAKKAERKARKAQGLVKQESENCQEAVEVVTPIDPVVAGGDATAEHSPMLAPEERGLDSEDCVARKMGEEEQLACCEAEMDVNIAELSTSDEVLVGLPQSEESTEESLGENPDFDEDSDLDVPSAEASVLQPGHDLCYLPPQAVWTCDEEFHGPYQPVHYDDAWMTPWEQVMRSRDEAEHVYQQLLDEMCMGTDAHDIEVQYQPVMCENNQQLYTDGEQLYMLACVDVSEDAGVAAPHLMQPVVDAHDPLHAEFLKDLRHNSMQRVVCH